MLIVVTLASIVLVTGIACVAGAVARSKGEWGYSSERVELEGGAFRGGEREELQERQVPAWLPFTATVFWLWGAFTTFILAPAGLLWMAADESPLPLIASLSGFALGVYIMRWSLWVVRRDFDKQELGGSIAYWSLAHHAVIVLFIAASREASRGMDGTPFYAFCAFGFFATLAHLAIHNFTFKRTAGEDAPSEDASIEAPSTDVAAHSGQSSSEPESA